MRRSGSRRRPIVAGALVWVVAGCLATTGFLPGQTPQAVAQDQVDETAQREELERIRRQAEEKRRRAQELKAKETSVLKELRATERKLRTTRTNIGQLTKREKQLERQLELVRSDLNRSRAALTDQRSRLALRLRNLYKYGRARELEFFLSAESFAQLLVRWDFIQRVARQDRRILLGIHEEKDRIESNQNRLDRTYEEVDKTLGKRQTESKQLDRLARQKQQSVTKIQSERKEYEAAAAELERTAKRIQQLLADLERRRREEEARRRAEAEGRQEPTPPAPYEGEFSKARGSLDWPLRGEVVGRYGNEKHPRFGTVTFNNGIDVRASQGEPVRAVARGRVDFTSQDYGSYGQMLILNHGSGYYTLYAHLSSIGVSRGQEVASGQVVGSAGDTGSLKGTILHFEIRQGRQSLNPLDWLR
jgi:septal ring factor EnvC (AmiA/AmiB activator)